MEGTQGKNSTVFFPSLPHLPCKIFVVDVIVFNPRKRYVYCFPRKLQLNFLYVTTIQLVELSNSQRHLYHFVSFCLITLSICNIAIFHELAPGFGHTYILMKKYFILRLSWELCFPHTSLLRQK